MANGRASWAARSGRRVSSCVKCLDANTIVQAVEIAGANIVARRSSLLLHCFVAELTRDDAVAFELPDCHDPVVLRQRSKTS